MNRRAGVLAFLLAASLSTHPQAGWQEFASTRGGFTAQFPSAPKEEKSVVKTDLGKVDLYQYSASQGEAFYMVAFNDYPASLKSKDPLEATVLGVLRKLGGSPSDVQSISLAGHPGRTARSDGTQFSMAARFFWVQQRLYQMLVVAPRGTLDESGAKRFLESFRLQSSPGTVAVPVAAAAASPAAAPPPAPPAPATLRIVSQPTAAEVYLDDKRRGITGTEEGKLVLEDLPPGSYKLRLSLAGYKDWAQTVALTSGQTTEIQAVMTVAGPEPFTLQDVLDMLRGEISPKRAATLVQQRGVDFALSDEIEKQIRDAGGDNDLLLAIAKARR